MPSNRPPTAATNPTNPTIPSGASDSTEVVASLDDPSGPADGVAELEWTAPGPGQWQCLTDHFPRSLTPAYRDILKRSFLPYGEALRDVVGLPTKGMGFEYVNGRPYMSPMPLVGKAGLSLPPKPILWVAARVHPGFRRCRRNAEALLRDRPWRAEVERWQTEERARRVGRLAAQQAVLLSELTDAELADHLQMAARTAEEGYTRHFQLHLSDQTPIGLLMTRATDWGVDPRQAIGALAGFSPTSSGGGSGFDELRDAVRGAERNGSRLGSGRRSLDDLRSLSSEVDTALCSLLDVRGWHLVTGYDLDALALVELPQLIIDRVTADGGGDRRHLGESLRARSDELAVRLRGQVPPPDRAEFDERLADARLCYDLRDDNGAILGAWTMGLLRRALLEAGRRLADRGALATREHVFELQSDEVRTMVQGQIGPAVTDVAARADRRAFESSFAPPTALGPGIDLPIDVLPAAMALVARAQLALLDSMGDGSLPDAVGAGPAVLGGAVGIGSAVVTARARVVADPADAFTSFEPGEILVTRATTPAWNALLPLAAGIVTEEGGPLSHAAVIARELDVAAIVGVAGAMDSFTTGDTLRLDPAAATVQTVAPGAPA